MGEHARSRAKRSGDGRAGGSVTTAGTTDIREATADGEAVRAVERGSAATPQDVLALQRAAGNRAVVASLELERPGRPRPPDVAARPFGSAVATHRATLSLQRAPAARAAAKAAAPSDLRNDYVDLINGFEDLAGAAVGKGRVHLGSVRFGKDLSRSHRYLLLRMRKALIEAKGSEPDARRAARARWPALAARLGSEIDRATRLGLPADILATVRQNLAAISEYVVRVKPRGPSQVETDVDYGELYDGMNQLLWAIKQAGIDKTDAVVPLNIADINHKQRNEINAVSFGSHLTSRHRRLLTDLQRAFLLARDEDPGSATNALAMWRSVHPRLRLELRRMKSFLIDRNDGTTLHWDGDIDKLRGGLEDLDKKLFVGGVYAAGHREAVVETNLQAPDQAFQEQRLKEVGEEFEEVNKLAEKAQELTGKKLLDIVLAEDPQFRDKLGTAVIELVRNPREILKAYHEFREGDVLDKTVTLAEVAEKTLALRNAFIKVGCTVLRDYADKALDLAREAGDAGAVARWGKLADWAEGKLKLVEKVEDVAKVIGIAVSAIKIINALIHRKWGEALEEAAITGAGMLADVAMKGSVAASGEGSASMAAGGAGMIAGTMVVVAGEVEALKGAAAMIEWCEETNVRDAATSFIDVCTTAASIEAKALVADVKLLAQTTDPAERALIEEKLASDTPYWQRHLLELSRQYANGREVFIGGQPALRDALGADARRILETPDQPLDWRGMAEQIRIVFAGANAMAKYVVAHYPRQKPTEHKGGEE